MLNVALFAKILNVVNYFHKKSILDVWLILNTPFEGIVQDTSWEELVIAPVVECLKTTARE